MAKKVKLSKEAAIAAFNEVSESIGGIKPGLNESLKAADLYKDFQQQIVDIELDEDDKKDLSDETLAVIAEIEKLHPDLEPTPDAKEEPKEAPAKEKKGKGKSKKEKEVEAEPVKPAKGKKGKKEEAQPEPEAAPEKVKKGKGKKEKEAVAETPPAKEKGKGKKSKGVNPAELAETIKGDKKLNKVGCIEIIDANPELFGDAVDTLKGIANPMVLKKQMRNVLEGGKVEMTETKKPAKKEKEAKSKKEAEPTLTEQVNAIEDLDALKALVKANSDSFPGVKAKKFDKVKKLRKALLEVVVEKVSGKKDKKNKRTRSNEAARELRENVINYLTEQIEKEGGKIGKLKLKTAGFKKFPEDEKQVRDQISYGKNEKYNKFKELLVEVDGVIGFASAMKKVGKPAKEEKKAEKPSKKDKGGKKDKKKGKKGKK